MSLDKRVKDKRRNSVSMIKTLFKKLLNYRCILCSNVESACAEVMFCWKHRSIASCHLRRYLIIVL